MINDWFKRWNIPPEAQAEFWSLTVPEEAVATPTDKRSEAYVQSEIRRLAPFHDVKLWRNNSGAMQDDRGNMVRFGLGNESKAINQKLKSSDLIGITPWVIKADDIGKTFGIFTAIECKAEGWKKISNKREQAQANYLRLVQKYGGIGYFCSNPEGFIHVSSFR